jgi:hypothetical protein
VRQKEADCVEAVEVGPPEVQPLVWSEERIWRYPGFLQMRYNYQPEKKIYIVLIFECKVTESKEYYV